MLKNILIKNFRNIGEAYYELGERNAFVGRNGEGKTNTLNAIYWLLTGEIMMTDVCENKKAFTSGDILPNENSRLLCEVEADLNGSKIKRTYKEVWTTERGTTNEVFKGYESNFYKNDIKVPSTKINEEILKLMDAQYELDTRLNKVAMIIDPFYLILKTDTKELRKTIFDLIGQISLEELLRTGDYSLALDIIKKGEAEKHRTILKSKINDYAPIISRKNGEISALECSFDEEAYNDLLKKKDEINKLFYSNIPNQDLINEERKLLDNEKLFAETQRELFQSQYEDRLNNPLEKLRTEFSKVKNTLNKEALEGNDYLRRIESNARQRMAKEDEIKSYESKKDKLIIECGKVWNQTFEANRCPNCGHELNKDDEEEFNRKRDENVEEIKKQIESIKSTIGDLNTDIANLECDKGDLLKKKAEITRDYKASNEAYNDLKAKIEQLELAGTISESDKTKALKAKIMDLTEVKDIIKDNVETLKQADYEREANRKKEIKLQLDEIENKLQTLIVAKANFSKCEIAKKELRQILEAKALEERQWIQLDRFCKEKIRLTNEKASLWFDVDFVMLEDQINGGTKEVCYPIYEDAKYENVNTANKVQIGLKIINAIKNNLHLGQIPVLFDGAESLDDLSIAKLNADQIITTIVTSTDNVELERI